MPKLLRPHVPYEVRCRVALRQLGYGPERADKRILLADRRSGGEGHQAMLKLLLPDVVKVIGCDAAKLHLDHDPALENRAKIVSPDGSEVVGYDPDANDPDALIYREGGFKGSAHDIKTRVRGERGQFADNVIAKRARRRAKKATKRKHKWPNGRKLQSRNTLRRK